MLTGDQLWIVARATGTASLVALALSFITGMAMRTGSLGWLSHNRGIRDLHGFATILWLPLGLVHVIALVFDPKAGIGLGDVLVPFGVPYARFAIGLGTISVQLLLVVLVSTWARRSLPHAWWLLLHRLSYAAFLAAFAHSLMSGTDLAQPLVFGTAWVSALFVIWIALGRFAERPQTTLSPSRRRIGVK